MFKTKTNPARALLKPLVGVLSVLSLQNTYKSLYRILTERGTRGKIGFYMPKQMVSFRYLDPLKSGAKTSLKSTTITKPLAKRDNNWLLSRLDHLWTNFFPDIPQENPVFIKFGRYSKFRLGSIRFESKSKHSQITITAMFKDPKIPVGVVDHTISHELCHYTHGFSSPRKQLHKYPHHGGVIKRELEERGLHSLVQAYRIWIKDYREELKRQRGWR